MLRQLGLRKANSCVSVCVCGAVCVSAILFICIINREKESQNKIIDARIFRATTSAAAGINDKRWTAMGKRDNKEETALASPEPKTKVA